MTCCLVLISLVMGSARLQRLNAAHIVQVLAVDMICFYPSISEATLRALCLLCLSSVYPAALATRAVAVVQHAVQASQVASCSTCFSSRASVVFNKYCVLHLLVAMALHRSRRKAARTCVQVTPEAFLSLLLSLLTGRSAQLPSSALDQGAQRARLLVGAACHALQAFPGGAGDKLLLACQL